MAGSDEKASTEEVPFDLNEVTIIKEGEAEILMKSKNKVFFNKAQVLNLSG